MKPIPRSYIMEFSAGLSGVNQTAKFKMRQALYEVDLSDIDAARAQIADIMVQVVGASDAMASTMAAGFYDGIREYQTGAALGATADSGWEPDSTKRATYGITDRLAKADAPDISMVEGLLTQRIGYEVKRSAGRTMYRNGNRDPNKPKFARIPLGGDSCEFCRMLASRGFAYNSEKSAGKHNPDHYHDGCRCEVVCSWEKDPRIAGLSEDEYNDRAYGEHRDAYRSWSSKDHSQHQANQAAKRKNRYTEDGRLKAGYSGERIDRQAAYTEADRKKVAARAAAQRGNTQRGTKRRSVSIEIDEFTPCLRRLSDGAIVQTHFEIISPKRSDFKNWEFDWTIPEKNGFEVRALYADGDDRIQGLIALKPSPENKSIHIDIVESAPFNNSHNKAIPGKEYNGVGGHLFAEAVKDSRELGYNGFVDFVAKTDLIEYYKEELGAVQAWDGAQVMFIEGEEAKRLYERYYKKDS